MKHVKSHFSRAIVASSAAIALILTPIVSAKKKAEASNEPPYYTPATTPLFNPYPELFGMLGALVTVLRKIVSLFPYLPST